MTAPRLLIFDDGQGLWGPMTDLRALFELRSGAWTTQQRIEEALGTPAAALRVPEALAAIMRQRYAGLAINEPLTPGLWWLVNARAAAPALLEPLRLRRHAAGAILRQSDGLPYAALLDQPDAQAFLRAPAAPASADSSTGPAARLLERPWHLLENLEATLHHDLLRIDLPRALPQPSVVMVGDHPIKIAPSARVHPMVVLNAEKGPIAIDESAIVGSFCVLAGPCYIGPHTIVQPHAHIRANTAVGPACVVAGEISHTIFQGFSNKAHDGYLGNAYLGQWVNFGAETAVSNLKNTYGTVRMQLEATQAAEETHQPKLGPLVGDFTRTAIGSRLLTGACFSTGTMLALSSFAPKFTPRFAFLTDQGIQRYELSRFLAAAAKAMARRHQSLTPAEEARLHELAALSPSPSGRGPG